MIPLPSTNMLLSIKASNLKVFEEFLTATDYEGEFGWIYFPVEIVLFSVCLAEWELCVDPSSSFHLSFSCSVP